MRKVGKEKRKIEMECKVRVNNIDYGIKVIDWDDERLRMPDGELHFGVTNMKENEIYIANNLPEQTMTTTLIHEVTHAYIDAYGLLQVCWTDEIVADFMGAHLENIINTLQKVSDEMAREKENGKVEN